MKCVAWSLGVLFVVGCASDPANDEESDPGSATEEEDASAADETGEESEACQEQGRGFGEEEWEAEDMWAYGATASRLEFSETRFALAFDESLMVYRAHALGVVGDGLLQLGTEADPRFAGRVDLRVAPSGTLTDGNDYALYGARGTGGYEAVEAEVAELSLELDFSTPKATQYLHVQAYVDDAVEVEASAFDLADPSGSSDFEVEAAVLDAAGASHDLRIYLKRTQVDPNPQWDVHVLVAAEDVGAVGTYAELGHGTLVFDRGGALHSYDLYQVEADWQDSESATIQLDFGTGTAAGGTGLDGILETDVAGVVLISRDGDLGGQLESLYLRSDGYIEGYAQEDPQAHELPRTLGRLAVYPTVDPDLRPVVENDYLGGELETAAWPGEAGVGSLFVASSSAAFPGIVTAIDGEGFMISRTREGELRYRRRAVLTPGMAWRLYNEWDETLLGYAANSDGSAGTQLAPVVLPSTTVTAPWMPALTDVGMDAAGVVRVGTQEAEDVPVGYAALALFDTPEDLSPADDGYEASCSSGEGLAGVAETAGRGALAFGHTPD